MQTNKNQVLRQKFLIQSRHNKDNTKMTDILGTNNIQFCVWGGRFKSAYKTDDTKIKK